MKLYKVTYKRYSSTNTFHVAASTVIKATERAKSYIKQKEYGDQEILTVEKLFDIEAFVR